MTPVSALSDEDMIRLAAHRAKVRLQHAPDFLVYTLIRWGGTNPREHSTCRLENAGGGRFTVPKHRIRLVELPEGFVPRP